MGKGSAGKITVMQKRAGGSLRKHSKPSHTQPLTRTRRLGVASTGTVGAAIVRLVVELAVLHVARAALSVTALVFNLSSSSP